MLIMVGDSYRFEGDSDSARRIYMRVRDKYGGSADIVTLVQTRLDQINTEENGDREEAAADQEPASHQGESNR